MEECVNTLSIAEFLLIVSSLGVAIYSTGRTIQLSKRNKYLWKLVGEKEEVEDE